MRVVEPVDLAVAADDREVVAGRVQTSEAEQIAGRFVTARLDFEGTSVDRDRDDVLDRSAQCR